MPYRVDNIPFFLKPFFILYSYTLGILAYVLFAMIHFSCRITFTGREHIRGGGNFIFAIWHDNAFPYFATFLHHEIPHIWMNHPAWYMKPIHVLLRLIGVKDLILGSTGHAGKEAADRLIEYLRQGYSTTILPDGPHGPPKVLKKGVLYMALQSGVPIVPLKILTPHCWTLKTWDRKRLPLPFSSIHVVYESPIVVTKENFEDSFQSLSQALG